VRRAIIAAAILLILPTVSACAPRVGVGIAAGEPTGISLKAWSDGTQAIAAAAGWSLRKGDWLYLHCDYLMHSYELDVAEFDGSAPYYFGVGGRVLLREGAESRVGIRVPLGIDYLFENGLFDVFVEIAPILDIIPETSFAFSGGAGIRFYFQKLR
jgi:hypothetical protein